MFDHILTAHNHEMEAQLVELKAALEAAKQQAAASEQALNKCRQREERALERNGQLVKENEKLQMELNLKHQRVGFPPSSRLLGLSSDRFARLICLLPYFVCLRDPASCFLMRMHLWFPLVLSFVTFDSDPS
jgi:hypothetical protein